MSHRTHCRVQDCTVQYGTKVRQGKEGHRKQEAGSRKQQAASSSSSKLLYTFQQLFRYGKVGVLRSRRELSGRNEDSRDLSHGPVNLPPLVVLRGCLFLTLPHCMGKRVYGDYDD
jgi:hypothetical protein